MSATWPEKQLPLSVSELEAIRSRIAPEFSRLLKTLQLPDNLNPLLKALYLPLAAWLAKRCEKDKPLIVGLNGSQGSGKSTLCQLLEFLLQAGFGLRSCVLSIDDLYLTHTERQQLAHDIHPLLATRGVPGTHDIALGQQVFDQLCAAAETSTTLIPRFDKASDDRTPEEDWERVTGRPDLILFEGWCVGATPQPQEALQPPINSLEELEDSEGHWRQYVNRQLSGSYQDFFSRLDLLLMLKVPDWPLVYQWRRKQEQRLIAANPNGTRVMDDQALLRFVMHYERLTRHQLVEMPKRADLLLHLNPEQQIERIQLK